MTNDNLDRTEAHRVFSVECFNACWSLIDQVDRTEEEDEQMLLLAMASLWHWTQREDATDVNLSVGYWQVSRVHALRRQGDEARRYGQLALEAAQRGEADAFTLGYAYEALARAEALAGDRDAREANLEKAKEMADLVTDEESRSWLLDDLNTIA